MTSEPGAHTECRKNYKILLLMMLTSVLTQKSNTCLDGSHCGSNCPCYEVILLQMPGICPRGWRVGGGGCVGSLGIDWYITDKYKN